MVCTSLPWAPVGCDGSLRSIGGVVCDNVDVVHVGGDGALRCVLVELFVGWGKGGVEGQRLWPPNDHPLIGHSHTEPEACLSLTSG